MNSLPERFSFVTERCTTCGQLLPCVLHNRKLREIVLKERDEMPEFEKTWEMERVEIKLENGTDDEHFCAAFSSDVINGVSGWRLMRLKRKLDDRWKIEMTQAAFIITGFEEEELILKQGIFRVFSGSEGRVRFIDLRSGESFSHSFMPWYEGAEVTYSTIDHLARYEDGLLVFGHFVFSGGNNEPFLKFLQPDPNSNDRFIDRDLRIKNFDLRNTNGIIREICRISDVEFLYAVNGSIRKLIPPDKKSNRAWSSAQLFDKEGQELMVPFEIRNLLTLLDGKTRRVLASSQNWIYLLEPESEKSEVWKKIQIMSSSDLPVSDESVPQIAILSPHCFTACFDKRTIWMFEENEFGEWSRKVVVQSDEQKVEKLEGVPGNPPGFFISGDYKLTFWTIPHAKLRAYHERQAAQKEVPSLPSDI